MSGLYVSKLKRRALNALRIAENTDDFDLAMFLIDQALQLYIKAVYFELFGSKVRGHGIRELIGMLIKGLGSQGFSELVRELRDFVIYNRDILIMLEEAYTEGRYGEISYDIDDISKALNVAKELIRLLDRVVSNVKLG
ncbi:HEPN domain-containing protein [Vulcanisaeta distributa]|uniref:HEPN domain protein n=1 Tax=Vulcanisaeta distributa (strain DSM 14429 / JCM 11212 / NBRC 100878 / IC-017) TaxID=572478 RepID=E1QSF0_VULDI|nr:HEPN domain-containing protein [Vulcanisaeta distributa]ADN50743.1 HEPN domain protein [Vulcanisaeta distributa DSM 14429]